MPGSAVPDGAQGVPGIPSPASPTAPGTDLCLGCKGLGRQGSVPGSLQTPVPRVTAARGSPQDSSDRCYLHQGVYYHRLSHNCILTLLNGSAELFKHPSLPPANNSLGKKEKNTGVGEAAKELPVALAPSFCSISLGTSGSTLSSLDPSWCTRMQKSREDLQ